MQERSTHSWLIPATGSLALLPAVAGASGFALLEQSASRLGTAFAGTAAAADDATTVFFNPAGMTSLREPEAVVSASGIEITSEFRNDSSVAAFAQPLGGNGGDAGDWNFVPAAYFVLPVGDDLAFGIGVNAPFGLKLVYDDGWIGRFQAVAQRDQDVERESVGCLAHRRAHFARRGHRLSTARCRADQRRQLLRRHRARRAAVGRDRSAARPRPALR